MHKPDINVGRTTIGNVVDILAENFGDKIQKYKLREMAQQAIA